ncbi:MAG: ATP-binding protein [Bacteroidales bacterium]
MNPFLLKGYISPKYFCDREMETEKIITSIKNQQDITIFAIRRIGKSALIHHIFDHFKKSYDCIYVDLWGTTSLYGFINEAANAVIQSTIFSKRSLSEKLTGFIRSIGASLSIGNDGRPSVDIIYHDRNQVFNRLEEIFQFLEENSSPVIIAFDEFQEIKKYTDSMPLEAKLRSLVQRYHNIRFIFSGSEQHLIADIFSSIDKPFYQSTRMIELKKIDTTQYHQFITTHFHTGNKSISDALVSHILTLCHGHTYYIQAICNLIYSQKKPPETTNEFEKIYLDFISEKQVFYAELPNRLTRHQFSTTKAIACLGKVEGVTTGDFMARAEIGSPGTMQSVITALMEKQVIIREGTEYRLYDVFLEHFLRYFG